MATEGEVAKAARELLAAYGRIVGDDVSDDDVLELCDDIVEADSCEDMEKRKVGWSFPLFFLSLSLFLSLSFVPGSFQAPSPFSSLPVSLPPSPSLHLSFSLFLRICTCTPCGHFHHFTSLHITEQSRGATS